MSFLTKIIDFFRPTPSIIKFSAVPNYEPEEVKPIIPEPEEVKPIKPEPEEVKVTRKPIKAPVKSHTKTSLMKLTKKQLEALGRKEFNVELDKRRTKAKLVKELLGTIKKAR